MTTMVSIASLLNPTPPPFEHHRHLPSPRSSTYTSETSPPSPTFKKQKMSKDAAIFAKGKIKGEIRYRPCEEQNEEIAAQHRRFQVYPMGKIAEYCRHIPYNSEKKSFLKKTGRESFEVFQYTYKVPGEETVWTVMWDYNVGLVRVTPFFKSCKYSKTTPSKVLDKNPGLRDISHSITGGALAAQGYWLPFEAAKAVTATFCYNIRYAMTPVFGLDFLSLCIPPGDPKFSSMIISRDIVRQCTDVANRFRELSRGTSQVSSPQTPSSGEFPQRTSKSLQHQPVKIRNADNEFDTDIERSDIATSPPQTPVSMEWTSVNQITRPSNAMFGLYHRPASPQIPTDTAVPEYSQSRASSSSEESRGLKRSLAEKDEDYDEESHSAHSSEGPTTPPKRRKKSTALTTEAKAAYMLMQLSMKDATLGGSESLRNRRRASS